MPPKTAVESFKSVMSTRSSNKNIHPGRVVLDATQKRRSGQEMEQVRAEEARAQVEKQRMDDKNLKSAAEIEDRIRQEDIARRASGRKIGGEPAFRPPPQVSTSSEMTAEQANKVESDRFREIIESEPSGDEYQPEDIGESEVDEEELSVDEEEDEGDKPAQKKKGKAPKLGRADITAARTTTAASYGRSTFSTTTTTSSHKRKTSGSSNTQASKTKKAKKQNQQPSGIIAGWDVTQTSKNGALAATSAPQASEDVDSMVEMGGFVLDEETDDVEKKAVAKLMPGSKKKSVSIVKVSETKPLIQLRTKQQQRGGAKKSTLSHLPQGAGPAFTELLAPLAKIMAGTLPAWASLSVQQIQLLVNDVYGIGTHIVVHDDVWCDLVGYRLSNWRNAFYTHARTAVNDHMSAFAGTDHSTEDLIDYVQVFTQSTGEPPSAPFHWKEWNSDEETLVMKRSGLFENDLIMFTLAHAHFSEFDEVPYAARMEKEEFPVGALILALQAVEHAFKFWATGEFVEDKTKQFSADKYDDKKERKSIMPGKPTIILTRRATLYLKTVQNLSVNKWASIFDQVNEVLNAGKKKKKGRSKSASSCADSDVFEESAPEFVLCSDEE